MFTSSFNDKKPSKFPLIWFYLFYSQMHLDINPLSLRDSNINQLKNLLYILKAFAHSDCKVFSLASILNWLKGIYVCICLCECRQHLMKVKLQNI